MFLFKNFGQRFCGVPRSPIGRLKFLRLSFFVQPIPHLTLNLLPQYIWRNKSDLIRSVFIIYYTNHITWPQHSRSASALPQPPSWYAHFNPQHHTSNDIIVAGPGRTRSNASIPEPQWPQRARATLLQRWLRATHEQTRSQLDP